MSWARRWATASTPRMRTRVWTFPRWASPVTRRTAPRECPMPPSRPPLRPPPRPWFRRAPPDLIAMRPLLALDWLRDQWASGKRRKRGITDEQLDALRRIYLEWERLAAEGP